MVGPNDGGVLGQLRPNVHGLRVGHNGNVKEAGELMGGLEAI